MPKKIPKMCYICAFNSRQGCSTMLIRTEDCFAYATKEEKERREKAIEVYIKCHPEERVETQLDVLNREFKMLYKDGLSDEEIASELYIHKSFVSLYRKNKGLKPNKKNRSVSTETAN